MKKYGENTRLTVACIVSAAIVALSVWLYYVIWNSDMPVWIKALLT